MNQAQRIMSDPNRAILAGCEMAEEPAPTNEDVIELAGDLLAMVSLANDIPVDFDGCALTILREPGTNKLTAVILSPVDMHGDEPFARYAVEPDRIKKTAAPKIFLPSM